MPFNKDGSRKSAFMMKGSPMQRNFGSALKHTQDAESKLSGDKREGDTSEVHNKAHADGKMNKDHIMINKK